MEKPTRMGTAAALFLLVAAMMVGVVPASGQGPFRPPTAPDISGEWRLENNEEDTTAQPPLGDYLGIPFNDAGRLRSDTTAESIWGTPEYQCRPHSAPHQWRGLGGARILKEQDPLSREVRAYHVQFMRSLDRPIFMDGRPHPPAWAPHSWTGFSTGEWVGNTLKVTTTHLKDGYLKRGGPQTSDMYTMTEFITRHAEILTIVTVVDDPIYLDEPYVQSTTYVSDPTASVALETCNSSSFAENGGSDRHWVPHFLPGQNTALGEWLKKEDWVPAEAARGGVKTLYPEYRSTFNASGNATKLTVPSSRSAVSVEKQITDQSPRDGDVHVLPVQGNVYLLIADGTNLTASVGPEGILLVNTGTKKMSDKVLAAINQLANATVTPPAPNTCFGANCPGAWGWASPYMNAVISSPAPPKPLRYIIDTSASPDHVGGNEKLATAGFFPRGAGFGAAVANIGRAASVIAHENVLNRMSAPGGKEPPAPAAAQPSDTYFDDLYKLPAYFNGEAVIVYHAPAANTDGDSLVYFRHSEVISAGDVFSTVSYPLIDVEKGGSIQGVLDGLNHILDLAVSEYRAQGGTWVIPGRGRVSDTADVASYRNMVTMIRDRVRDLKNKGMTIEQVKAARPTLDFDGRYGSSGCPPSRPPAGRSSFGGQPSRAAGLPAEAPSACAMSDGWTTEMFVEAVYRTLPEKREGKDKK